MERFFICNKFACTDSESIQCVKAENCLECEYRDCFHCVHDCFGEQGIKTCSNNDLGVD